MRHEVPLPRESMDHAQPELRRHWRSRASRRHRRWRRSRCALHPSRCLGLTRLTSRGKRPKRCRSCHRLGAICHHVPSLLPSRLWNPRPPSSSDSKWPEGRFSTSGKRLQGRLRTRDQRVCEFLLIVSFHIRRRGSVVPHVPNFPTAQDE